MTVREVFAFGKEELEEITAEADIDAWYLLEYVFGINRSQYLMMQAEEADTEKTEHYKAVLEKRKKRIPLQHITGSQEFMGIQFKVNEHVLVPRQDTETLVEEAEKVIKDGMHILDVCTGSGCILLSLLKRNKGITGTGCDISEAALDVAEENNKQLDLKAEFIKSDLFDQVQGEFHMIVSNPPYIPTADIEELMPEVREHEPVEALDGKEDGLYFYRKIIREAKNYLVPGGHMFLEIGYNQGYEVSEMLKNNGYEEVSVVKDLAGNDRVVSCRFQPET